MQHEQRRRRVAGDVDRQRRDELGEAVEVEARAVGQRRQPGAGTRCSLRTSRRARRSKIASQPRMPVRARLSARPSTRESASTRAANEDVPARRDLQPGDLREGDPRQRRLRRADRAAGRRGPDRARDLPARSRVAGRPARADVLRPVCDETDGARRLRLARGRAASSRTTPTGTLEQAREYWEPRRPPEPDDQDPGHRRRACRRSSRRSTTGININVTLLFSRRAVRRRSPRPSSAGWSAATPQGKSLDVHSVASFFVSRVDTEVDKRLEAPGDDGAARAAPAVANARAAYQRFKEIFQRRALRGAARRRARRCSGRCGRRPASRTRTTPTTCTSTTLVGPDTVNTMPMPTLRRRRASAVEVTGPTVDEDPSADLERAGRRRASTCDDVTEKLLRDGIDAFVIPIDEAARGHRAPSARRSHGHARRRSRRRIPRRARAAAIEARAARRERACRAARLGARRHRCGAPAGSAGDRQPPRLARRSPSACSSRGRRAARRSPTQVHADGLTDAVLLGMGGSSLAPGGAPALVRRRHADGDRCTCSTRPTPTRCATSSAAIDLATRRSSSSRRSRAARSRRSRTSSYFYELHRRQRRAVRRRHRPGHAAGGSWRDEHGFRRVFVNDPDIGGRYSRALVLRARAGRAAGVDLDGACSAGARAPSPRCASRPGEQPRPLARRRARRARARRARQADLRRRRADRRASASGSSS